jgi:hypothetical protein
LEYYLAGPESFVAQESFSLPESVLDKATACFRRLQNSPSAQTVVIAYLTLRRGLLAKTLSTTAQIDSFGQQFLHGLGHPKDLYIFFAACSMPFLI